MENKTKIEDSCGKKPDGLHLSRQEMLDLASNVTEILVDRIKALPAEDAWDGEFRQELDHLLMKPASALLWIRTVIDDLAGCARRLLGCRFQQ